MKIGRVDSEIALLNLKKKKKLTQAKYIALLAGLPSGLNKEKNNGRIHNLLCKFTERATLH